MGFRIPGLALIALSEMGLPQVAPISRPAPRSAAPASPIVFQTPPLKMAAGEQVVAEYRRLQAAEAAHESARKCFRTAHMAVLMSQGRPGAERHQLRLEHAAATKRAEAAAAALERCRREFAAAVRAFNRT